MQTVQSRIKRRKKFLKLRRHRTWVTVLLMLLYAAVTVLLLGVFFPMMACSVLEAKMQDEYNLIHRIAVIYDGNGADTAILENSGYDYVLEDANGKILTQHGEDTRGGRIKDNNWIISGTIVSISFGNSAIETYGDTENELMKYTDEGISLDLMKMFQRSAEILYENEPEKEIAQEETDASGAIDDLLYNMRLPIWIAANAGSSAQKIIFRSDLRFKASDIVVIALALTLIMLLLISVFFVMLFNLIHNIANSHRIRKLFFTDLPTKGHNWIWFLVNAEQLLRKRSNAKKCFAIAQIVIVKYRSFCVCHSLEEGEQVVKQIHDYLVKALGRKEMCAHASEDSFSLLLTVSDQAALRTRMQELINGLSHLDESHSFAFQAGVDHIEPASPSERKTLDLEQLYNNACTARLTLEASDDSGIAYFDDALVEAQKWESRVQELQQSALDNEEFIVYYQPKYDPRTKLLRGAEALIRWQSPELGFVSPGRFIPIFEKNGFITEIDHYMLRHVAHDQKRWLDLGLKCVPVSVNVSRAHFIESDLAEQICQLIDSEGAPHALIEIELTESAFFDDKKAMIATITKLKNAGFAVSMDDFGSGYSSLNSLKDMPLDVLKLDADFFRGETPDSDRGEIVIAEAIKLAKCLNMHTVAEGVEQREQVEFLAAQGCDMIQGYYFAKPMPGTDYEDRLRLGRSDIDDQVSAAPQE